MAVLFQQHLPELLLKQTKNLTPHIRTDLEIWGCLLEKKPTNVEGTISTLKLTLLQHAFNLKSALPPTPLPSEFVLIKKDYA